MAFLCFPCTRIWFGFGLLNEFFLMTPLSGVIHLLFWTALTLYTSSTCSLHTPTSQNFFASLFDKGVNLIDHLTEENLPLLAYFLKLSKDLGTK